MRLAFFYPSKKIGGAQLLFLRIAIALSKCKKYKVFLIDFKDGYNVPFIEGGIENLIYEKNKLNYYNDIDVLISPLSHINEVRTKLVLKDSCKLLFWGIHPLNIINLFNPLPFQRFNKKVIRFTMKYLYFFTYRLYRKFFKYHINKGVIFFMDLTNFNETKFLLNLKKVKPTYIPIPLNELSIPLRVKKKNMNNSPLRVFWLGRLDFEKKRTLDILSLGLLNYAKTNKVKIILSVIATKKHESEENNYFQVENYGVVVGDNLTKLLKTKADMLFAMGTSCLEGARLSIPSVLLDNIQLNINFKKVKYLWLFESEGYSLGKIIKSEKEMINPHSLEEIMNSLSEKSNRIGEQCYKYYIENHYMEISLNKLLIQITKTNFCFKDLIEDEIKFNSNVKRILRKVYHFKKTNMSKKIHSFND